MSNYLRCVDNRSDEACLFCFSYCFYFAISSPLKYSGKSGITCLTLFVCSTFFVCLFDFVCLTFLFDFVCLFVCYVVCLFV